MTSSVLKRSYDVLVRMSCPSPSLCLVAFCVITKFLFIITCLNIVIHVSGGHMASGGVWGTDWTWKVDVVPLDTAIGFRAEDWNTSIWRISPSCFSFFYQKREWSATLTSTRSNKNLTNTLLEGFWNCTAQCDGFEFNCFCSVVLVWMCGKASEKVMLLGLISWSKRTLSQLSRSLRAWVTVITVMILWNIKMWCISVRTKLATNRQEWKCKGQKCNPVQHFSHSRHVNATACPRGPRRGRDRDAVTTVQSLRRWGKRWHHSARVEQNADPTVHAAAATNKTSTAGFGHSEQGKSEMSHVGASCPQWAVGVSVGLMGRSVHYGCKPICIFIAKLMWQ